MKKITGMKIGYDGKRAVANFTGLGNYSRLVLESLGESKPEWHLRVYAPQRRENPRLDRLKQMSNVEWAFREEGSILPSSLWRSYGITSRLRTDGIDLYHGLSNELPLNISNAGIPTVLTMHDVIYRRLPYCYTRFNRLMCDLKYGRSCRTATRIIAISECTKRDIMHYYGVNEERIDVVYQGCDPAFRRQCSPDEIAEARARYDLPEHYLLQVGTIERRKNAELSVRALSAIADRDIKLVLVGRDNHYLDYLRGIAAKAGVADRLIAIHNVSFADLPAVNQGAEVILYPSRYEGFGIPVLEALESRRPVIAATGSCLEEAGGDGTLYVNPDDPRALARGIDALIDAPDAEVNAIIAKGVQHAARFDNDTLAAQIIEVYNHAMADYRNKSPSNKKC